MTEEISTKQCMIPNPVTTNGGTIVPKPLITWLDRPPSKTRLEWLCLVPPPRTATTYRPSCHIAFRLRYLSWIAVDKIIFALTIPLQV
ncbi:hypothetical protein PoB_000153900 [Plakobranchus ocellatus]|uniref:Uncharacterized protein n=1 Tax=Plakobranchus ocellatus TaxID=259542 RepID=A0AAV3XYL4_9GAST|nr:hypothetical protein PoB_000153900 [Plakobranchus ocellatus]